MKHAKVTTYSKDNNGDVNIKTESYYEQLAHEVVEIEKHILTTFDTLQKDVDEALVHITDRGTSQLVLTIKVANGVPKLTKRWITLKKDYPRQ